MKGFFKKFMGDSAHGRPCKECGHAETSHNLKIVNPQENLPYNNPAIRSNCKECSCTQFK
jgi:hypothetical protein